MTPLADAVCMYTPLVLVLVVVAVIEQRYHPLPNDVIDAVAPAPTLPKVPFVRLKYANEFAVKLSAQAK